jgi:ABC-type transport system involved in multi-copper enzyme maturation permease subunit
VSFSDRLGSIDRVQKSRPFMIAATVIVVLLAAGTIGWAYLQAATDPSGVREALATTPEFLTDAEGNQFINPQRIELRTAADVISAARSPNSLTIGVLLAAGVVLLVLWLGLGLSYLAILLAALAIGLPMLLNPRSAPFGFVIIGGSQLTLAFIVLLRGASLLFTPARPVLAIARNVLAEAIRMKVSLIFIAMLIVMLASLPLVLNGEQPLRFRVQAFLQYANQFAFWITALLVLFFGAATVAFEQRDKIIWQTMTKPVSAAKYVLGKWLGVVTLAAVLVLVSSAGVFMFTEYLRGQPAGGEVRPYEPRDASLTMTEDRMLLETRVLTARKPVVPNLPFDPAGSEFDRAVEQRIEGIQRLGDYTPSPADRARFRDEAVREAVTAFRSIDPNTERYQEFEFSGLQDAKRRGVPLTLRYKINAEGNRPDIFYALTFIFEDGTPVFRERTGLGFSHTITIAPEMIDDRGQIRFRLYNGLLSINNEGGIVFQPNTNSITIPSDGLEISYQVGSFQANFLRVQAVQWVKLAFLAMLAVCAATFLSFPVACLVAIGTFFIAESSGWVTNALPGWGTTDTDGNFQFYRWAIYHFAETVSGVFRVYNDLSPAERLADGRLLSWGSVSTGAMFLIVASAAIYGIGVYAFRSRQLAIYSGH